MLDADYTVTIHSKKEEVTAMNATVGIQPVNGRHPCYWHPEVETGLRCSNVVNGEQCPHFICPKCAKRTSVGYKCPDCIQAIEGKIWDGEPGDYLIAMAITLLLSLLTALGLSLAIALAAWFPWFVVLLTASPIADFIVKAVRWGVHKRRSRYLKHVVAGCFAAAILPFLIASALVAVLVGNLAAGAFQFGLIDLGILLAVGEGAIWTRW
jgi:hypothetical protein